jgi:hypothetical protein
MLERPRIRRYSPSYAGSDNATGADNQQETRVCEDPQRLYASRLDFEAKRQSVLRGDTQRSTEMVDPLATVASLNQIVPRGVWLVTARAKFLVG